MLEMISTQDGACICIMCLFGKVTFRLGQALLCTIIPLNEKTEIIISMAG